MSSLRGMVLHDVVRGLTDPALAGVLVKGGAGMGKTQLAQRAVEVLFQRYHPSWLVGQRLLAEEPLAVLATYLERGEPGIILQATELEAVQMLHEYLHGRASARAKKPMMVIDDAQWVDKESCAVLEQLAISGGVPMLLLCRPGSSTVAQSALFTDDTILAQQSLETLSPSDVLAASEMRLGGKIVPGASAVLGTLSGGNPQFLQAILGAALEQEAFVCHGNVWALASSPMEPDANVGDLAIGLLNEFEPREQDILESVALAEPLSAALLHRLFPGSNFEALVESRVLRISPGARSTVQFVSPVFGQSLRQRIPVGRSVEIRRKVLETRASLPLSSGALIRHVAWSVECGVKVPPRTLLHAARVANLHDQPQLAQRFTGLLAGTVYSFQARLESVFACIKLEQFAHAKDLLVQLDAEAATKEQCDCVGTLTVMLAAMEGYPAGRLQQPSHRWRTSYTSLGVKGCAGADVVQALIVAKAGNSVSATMRRRLVSIGGAADHVGLKFAAIALLAQAEALEGDQESANRDFKSARMLLLKHQGWLGLFRHVLTGQHMVFLAEAGSANDALGLLHDVEADDVNHPGIDLHGLTEMIRASAHRARGELVEAAATYDIAIAALGEVDPVHVLPYALASAAYTQELMGCHDRAADLAHQFHAAAVDDSVPLWLLSKAYLATIGAQRDQTHAALVKLAQSARRQGAAATELAIHTLLVRSGCTSYLWRIPQIKTTPAGPAIPMFQALAGGLLAADPGALERVADMTGAEENKLLAVESLSHALQAYSSLGDHQGRVRVLIRLRQMEFPFQGTGSVAIAELAAAAELTWREKEIAELVHKGYSNRDIAEKFTLSQRTIEGHLYKIYSKLGVGSRDELYEPWLPILLSTAGK